MNTPSSHTGFTRKELALAIGLIGTGISCFALAQEPAKASADVTAAAKRARNIHTLLYTWAQDNNQVLPTATQSSNEAFRELFKARIVDDERLFAIPGDAWHNSSTSKKGPDGNTGTAPEFAEALASGECAWAYVSGWTTASRSDYPLIANAFTESIGVYSNDKSHKGGVFEGKQAIYVTVGGSAFTPDLNDEWRIMAKKGSKTVDVFSNDYGTNPDHVKNPEG